ncbi:MAG: hypothetical protein OXE99_10000 [Cellvibrionales bacterium]|nr:hypothetical protein [Cellvibrionales bacterium]
MSDIGVSYDLSYAPKPVGVDIKLGISGTKVKFTLSGVPALAVTATPYFSGNVLESALSAVATPMANAITLSLGAFAGNIINNTSFDVVDVPDLPFNIEGVSGKLSPKNLNVFEFNGQLKLAGDFDLV